MCGVVVMCERWLTLGGRGRRVWGLGRDFDVMMDIYKRDHKKVHITFYCAHKGGGGVRLLGHGQGAERGSARGQLVCLWVRCGEGPDFLWHGCMGRMYANKMYVSSGTHV